MELLKSVLQVIVSAAEKVDVEMVRALLIFYLVASAVLLLVMLVKGVRRW